MKKDTKARGGGFVFDNEWATFFGASEGNSVYEPSSGLTGETGRGGGEGGGSGGALHVSGEADLRAW